MTSTPSVQHIPLLNLRRQTLMLRPEIDAAIGRVLDHGQFILGPEVDQLELEVAKYCGSRYAVSCASGTDALLLPLMALGVGPGDSVITSPFTFFATAGSISRLGARPAFVDIDPTSFNLCPARLRSFLAGQSNSALAKIKAIIPVHLFGQCAAMAEIGAIAKEFGIPVIEDAAQAIGAACPYGRAGTLGLCGAFSFFPSKNLGGFGDGGMITTDDEEFARRLRLLRVHGSGPKYYHSVVGINSRLDTLQAAILLVHMRYLENWNQRRREHALFYQEQMDLLLSDIVGVPRELPGMHHVFNQFTVRVPRRDAIRAGLTTLGISTEIYYPLPLHMQACFADLGYANGEFPESERAAEEVLSLPIDPGLSFQERTRITESLRLVCGEVCG